jgi:PAS domain S-box-containing protein
MIMTIIDLVIIGLIIAAFRSFLQNRALLKQLKLNLGVSLILIGLLFFMCFYLADLVVMYLFPAIMPMAKAMEMMRRLHLNYMWIISILGLCSIVVGLVYLVKVLFPKVASLIKIAEETQQELENRVEERTKELNSEIIERKHVEQALQNSETNLIKAQEVAQIGSWHLNLPGNNLVWTDEIYKMFGVPLGTPMNYEGFLELVHPEDKNYVDKKWKAAIEGAPYDIEHRLLIDNKVKWVREKAELVIDDNGSTVEGIGITQDITERKRLEETSLQAQKLESVGILAGGIAHDFNNILTGILGNISLAKIATSPESKVFKRLTEAENATDHATTLAKQLLTFSKGGVPIRETAYAMNLIKDSVSFSLRGSNISYEYSIQEDLWPVDMDMGQINQVISNLVINARHAMPGGGLLKVGAENITIGTDKEDTMDGLLKEGQYIKISIDDNGTGIGKEHLDKIFDPYFTTKEKGSGLGLATSYSIIKKHSGHITVESQIGAGTTFSIYLPASKKKIAGDKGREGPAASLKEKKHKGMKVLVMDDEAVIRDVVGEMLTSLGYEVDFAIEGDEAIGMYRKAKESGEPFGAVIMDLTIPGGMGGKEAVKKLLEIDPGVKVIVSSGYYNDPIMANFRNYGFSGVINKPYTITDLGAMLHQVITGKI